MKRISPERKATTLAKLLPPYNMTVATDRGWQYCSADYQALLKRYNLHGSISAKGCCYDNACAESVFLSLKVECIQGERFISREKLTVLP